MKSRSWRGTIGLVSLFAGLLIVAAYLSQRLLAFAGIGAVVGFVVAFLVRYAKHRPSREEEDLSTPPAGKSRQPSDGKLVLATVAAAGILILLGVAVAIPRWLTDVPDAAMGLDRAAEPPELVEVGYRGVAEYLSDEGSWSVQHTLSIDSTQMSLSVPSGPSRPKKLLLSDVLQQRGWTELARAQDSVVYLINANHAYEEPRLHASGMLKLPLPTVGRYFAPRLLVQPRAGSELIVRAPEHTIIETSPKAYSREKVLDAETEILRIALPIDHGLTREVKLRIASSPLRSSFGAWVLNLTGWELIHWLSSILFSVVVGWWFSRLFPKKD